MPQVINYRSLFWLVRPQMGFSPLWVLGAIQLIASWLLSTQPCGIFILCIHILVFSKNLWGYLWRFLEFLFCIIHFSLNSGLQFLATSDTLNSVSGSSAKQDCWVLFGSPFFTPWLEICLQAESCGDHKANSFASFLSNSCVLPGMRCLKAIVSYILSSLFLFIYLFIFLWDAKSGPFYSIMTWNGSLSFVLTICF